MKLYFKPIFVVLLLTLASCAEKTEPVPESEDTKGQPPTTTVEDTQDKLKEATNNAENQVEESLEEDIKSPPPSVEKEDLLPEEKEKQEQEMIDDEEHEPMPTD